ncbi:MAG: TerC family protein [Bacteroidia bacterium]
MFEIFYKPEIWLSLITLTVMEIVLGIDNIIFISLVTSKLERKKQHKARRIGLVLALFIRVLLLSVIAYIVRELRDPVFTIMDHGISWRDMILIAGGLFLIYKSTLEIYELLEVDPSEISKDVVPHFWNVVFMVILIDIVFSFDSIITAVGLAQNLSVMIGAVIISMFIMLFFSGIISKFINKHPSIKLLALAFLVVIGVLLLIEGWDQTVSDYLKLRGYVYFGMAFSVAVEILNIRLRKKKSKSVELKDIYK